MIGFKEVPELKNIFIVVYIVFEFDDSENITNY